MESAVVQVGSDGTGVLITRNDSDTADMHVVGAMIIPVVITSYVDSNGSGTADIRVRGGTSVMGSNAPLVVVDGRQGLQQGALANINPSDVKSMDILKDASATAIYGAQGANAASALVALQIRTSGVQIISGGGEPGAGMENDMKRLTIGGGVAPLYIVDGIPSETLIRLQAEFGFDIDAAAGAIYGARAAN